ncbi:MAG: thermonuclease family protein [Candidatus Thiodiazotropha sp. DIVDIV]
MRRYDARSMVTKVFEKAPQCGAFLLFALPFLIFSSLSLEASVCKPCSSVPLKVDRVVDGDTLRLKSGEKIRLIGINTPELGHWGKPEQPGGLAAKAYLQKLISQNGGRVAVCPGAEKQDRYGRQLVHLSGQDGQNIAAQLLREGMGWAIAVPPNLSRTNCYFAAESEARDKRFGIWKEAPSRATSLQGNETGFHHLEGRIVRVGESRSALWLNLEGPLALRITWKDWKAFGIDDPEQLVGHSLEARGWLYKRKGQQRLRIRHPSSIRWLD